jgi:hypothetical protein
VREPKYNSLLDEFAELNNSALEKYLKAIVTAAKNGIGKFVYDPSGDLFLSAENSTIQQGIYANIDQLTAHFLAEMFAEPGYFEAASAGEYSDPPDTLHGDWAAKAAELAQAANSFKVIDARILLANKLNYSMTYTSSQVNATRTKIVQMFEDSVRRGDKPTQLQNAIEGLGIPKGLAYTITHGTFMGTYRGYHMDQGREMGAKYYTLNGPALIETSHELCLAHAGESHTLEEWEAIADRYDIPWVDFQTWGGGYNCRRTLDPEAVDMTRETLDKRTEKDQAYYYQTVDENGDLRPMKEAA